MLQKSSDYYFACAVFVTFGITHILTHTFYVKKQPIFWSYARLGRSPRVNPLELIAEADTGGMTGVTSHPP